MGQALTILLVEDSDFARMVAEEYLKEMEHTVYEAVDGMAALEQLKELNKVDLIISDWEMPEMDGLEFLKNVRKDEKFKDIPFIILSAMEDQSKVDEASQAGATDYIVKPMDPDILQEKIQKIFGKK